MYRKTTVMFVAFAMFLVALPATGVADGGHSEESSLAAREAVDMSDAEPLEVRPLHEFFTENPLTLAVPTGPVGNDAGCQATDSGFEWAAAGTPAAPCDSETFTYGVTHTGIQCASDSACSADIFDYSTFAFSFVSCEAGGIGIVDWGQGQVFSDSCEASVSGDPTSYGEWDSLGGDGTWSHTDNPVDAVVKILGVPGGAPGAPGLPAPPAP